MNKFILISCFFFVLLNDSIAQRPVCAKKVDTLIARGVEILYSRSDSALLYFDGALRHALNCSDSLGIVKAKTFIALCRSFETKDDEATTIYNEALNIAERNDFKKDRGIIFNNLGAMSFEKGDLELADTYYTKALIQMTELKDTLWLTKIYTNIAGVYFMKGDYDKSVAMLEETLEMSIHIKLYETVGGALANLAVVYTAQGKKNEALLAFDNGIYLLDSIGDKRGQCFALRAKAETEESFGLVKKAKNTASSALDLAIIIKHKESIYKSYELLSKLSEKDNQLNAALSYSKQAANWKDSVNLEQKDFALEELATKYESREKSTQINYLTKEAILKDKILQKKNKEKKYLLLVLFLVGVIAAALIYLLYLRRKLVHQLSKKNEIIGLSLKEKELLMKEIHHRVKNNLQVVASMLNIHASSITDESIKKVLLESRSRVESMSLVHKKLYEADNLGTAKMNEFIPFISNETIATSEVGAEIDLQLNIQDIVLSNDLVVPFGLILAEALTNSLKHAFSDSEKGSISIDFRMVAEEYQLEIRDNGSFSIVNFKSDNSFGHKLMNSLARGMKADLVIEEKQGCSILLTFKTNE